MSKYIFFFWSVFSCDWTECRKIRTRKNSVFGNFSHSVGSEHFSRWMKKLPKSYIIFYQSFIWVDCPKKSLFWRISQNLPENTPQGVSLQETPGQVFPSEFCEIFKNTFFKKHHWTTPSMNQYQMLFPENSPTEI